MKAPLVCLSLALLTVSFAAHAEMHTWTNLEGQKLEAEMVGLDTGARAVRLRRPDGQIVSVSIRNLSAEDVAYAAAQWRLMQANGSPAAAPTAATAGALNLTAAGPRYANRCSEAARQNQILKSGGSAAVEEAVGKSLDWLKAQQNADGSWGVRNKGAMTGFALQCFAGRCEGLQSAKFGEAVTKGTLFLIELAKKNPHGLLTEDVAGTPGAYEHAIAATALGEMFVLATAESAVPPGLEETFVKAMKVIVDMQGKMGSWDYYSKQLAAGEPPSTREDLSVANWHFQALAVARDTRLKIPGLEACIARAVDYIDDKRTKDGGFGKTVREAHYNQWFLSGGAIAGLQGLAPSGSKTKVSRGIEFLRDYLSAEPMQWDKTCNLYAWVNNTTAFYLAGGSDWDFYVKQWLPEILGAQSPDGSFRKGRPDWPAADAADPVYRQTLCTLQLQVFYRHAN